MRAFIENEADSKDKNNYDQVTLKHVRTLHDATSIPVPFPYGFIPETTSGDGDCLDCFVVTKKRLRAGETVDGQLIGMVELIDTGKQDNKLLLSLTSEGVVLSESDKSMISNFLNHMFDHRPNRSTQVGSFQGPDEAKRFLKESVLR